MRCASGFPDAPRARKPIRSRSCCGSTWTSSGASRKFSCSPPISTSRRSRPRGWAAIRRHCWRGCRPERRERFFTLSQGSYVVSKEIRDLCTFSTHNLVRDPPFSRMDLVSCRNLLIYMNPDLQAKSHSDLSLFPGAGTAFCCWGLRIRRRNMRICSSRSIKQPAFSTPPVRVLICNWICNRTALKPPHPCVKSPHSPGRRHQKRKSVMPPAACTRRGWRRNAPPRARCGPRRSSISWDPLPPASETVAQLQSGTHRCLARNCNRSSRSIKRRSKNFAARTRNCIRSTRRCNRPTRNWRPPRRNCSRSTRNCTPSMCA